MSVFYTISDYADNISSVHMPNAEWVPKNGMLSEREFALALALSPSNITAWDNDYSLADLISTCEIVIKDVEGNQFRIRYISN